MLHREKQVLDSEFSKLPLSSANSLAMKNKKKEVDFELDLNLKNINHVKQKLRDLNVL